MGIIKVYEIRGYHLDKEIVCPECLTKEEKEDAKEKQILTKKDVDGEDLYFCDRCGKRL